MDNPPRNTSTHDRPSFLWVEEPKRRGTFGILSLCFSTLVICVWSTLHFDIPTIRHSRTRRCFLQIRWTVFALFAPEALLYSAILERIGAEALVKAAEEHFQDRKPGMFTRAYNYIFRRAKAKSEDRERNTHVGRTSRLRNHRFGIVHAFYMDMGGFKFDVSNNDGTATAEETASELSRNAAVHFLYPVLETVVFLMKHFPHIIPDIPEESITDRAESSTLNKALLIIQVGWFCMNCASRLIEHLPLSLLEVSTAAHGFCTLLTFFVWWSKPLNIAEGTIIKGREARGVYGLLMCSDIEYIEALEMAKSMGARVVRNTNEEERIALAASAVQQLPNPEGRPLYPFYDIWVSQPATRCTSRQIPSMSR